MKIKDKIKYKMIQSSYKPGKSKIWGNLKTIDKMEKEIEDLLSPKKKEKTDSKKKTAKQPPPE